MNVVPGFQHAVGSHCETGSLRNLLRHAGLDVSEPMVFGVGSGPAFYYVFFAKGPSTFPLIGIRNPPSTIVKNVGKRCGLGLFRKKLRTTDAAVAKANALLDAGQPVAVSVDLFYMKYLPPYLQVHAPFHFILLVGREGRSYTVSDPYFETLATLSEEDLRAAWETHAPFSADNFLCHVEELPASVDWKPAVRAGILDTCRMMLPPPGIRNVLAFVGVGGMRMYARKLLAWPQKYSGHVLREGIMFNAVAFEDQGTGGAAFRLMYGAFLQEAGERFGVASFGELAEKMIEHGKVWRRFSRKMIQLGKKVPLDDADYPDWQAENGTTLNDGLQELSSLFLERAAFEEGFFRELRAAAGELK